MVKPRSGGRNYTASMLKWISLAIATVTVPAAFAQNCGSYKNQLEALLVLPAGKYRVEDFQATTEQKTLIRRNGAKAWVDGFGKITNSPESDGRVKVRTHLDYEFPRIQIKVLDSTTKGRRLINQRLSCTYVITYPALNQRRSLESDIEVSDSGSARFFVQTIYSDDPRNFTPLTNKIGADIAFGLIAAAMLERDKHNPQLSGTASQVYAEKLAAIQAEENAAMPKHARLVDECKKILQMASNDLKSGSGWATDRDKIDYYTTRFTNTQCSNKNLPNPKQWIAGGEKPLDTFDRPASSIPTNAPTGSVTPTTKVSDPSRGNAAPQAAAPQKSPKDVCANEPSFVRGMCETMTCITPEFQGHPYCATLQSSNR